MYLLQMRSGERGGCPPAFLALRHGRSQDQEPVDARHYQKVQRLIDDLDDVDYIERVKIQQRNWIGRSTGAEVDFKT